LVRLPERGIHVHVADIHELKSGIGKPDLRQLFEERSIGKRDRSQRGAALFSRSLVARRPINSGRDVAILAVLDELARARWARTSPRECIEWAQRLGELSDSVIE
jgi:hypothetical protein